MLPRFLLLPVLALFILSSAATTARADAKDDELKKMKGTWTVVSATKDGEPMPENEMKDATFVFEGDTISMVKGDRKEPVTVKAIDTSKTPNQIDLQPPAGGAEKIEGIYKLDGDTLELCFKKMGRPADFNQGKDVMYMKLKRQK
jgi:uncharacterized protein (TIGR03067 family)